MASATYLNPVYAHEFPDPFVLKFCGEYWAYCSGLRRDGRVFGILHSCDLVHWQVVGSALDPLPGNHTCYWAPEVTYDNGRFFLYYSVGNEATMHIRVAVATSPAGPFLDGGRRLTSEPFAIDAHLFLDDDGRRYLFYATDFLEHTHVGTGTVVDRLLDPFTLAGRPCPVTRACYDWHIYDPQRVEKGGVRWHTLEGPFVLKHKGIYYQMFSGGNWRNDSYGVGYATTHTLETAAEWAQPCDGEFVMPILRTVPGLVIGPGHNSAIRGPDNRQLYCIYHRWGKDDERASDGRLLAIDPLDWAGERMLVLGPSSQPQPAPLGPTFADFFTGENRHELGHPWQIRSGQWQVQEGAAVARVANPSNTVSIENTAEASYEVGVPFYAAELSLRSVGNAVNSIFGIRLGDNSQTVLAVSFQPDLKQLIITWQGMAGWQKQSFPLAAAFDFHSYHLLRWEVDGRSLTLTLDETAVHWQGTITLAPTQITLYAEQTPAAFAGFAVTVGWEDLFTAATTPAALGWISDDLNAWQVKDRQLTFLYDADEGMAWKGPFLGSYELVVNVRLTNPNGVVGFFPALTADSLGPLLTIERDENGWVLHRQDEEPTQTFSLPAHFDPAVYQQFRFRKENGQLTCAWESHLIGHMPVTTAPTRVGLYGRATAAFDLVRVIAIPAQSLQRR